MSSHLVCGGPEERGCGVQLKMSMPDNIVTPEGVEFRPNLLASTSLDGSLATSYKRTVTMVVCDNTHHAARSQERGGTVKYRHTSNSISRIADARVALQMVHTTADDFAAEVRALTQQTVTNAEWHRVLDALAPKQPADRSEASQHPGRSEAATSSRLCTCRTLKWPRGQVRPSASCRRGIPTTPTSKPPEGRQPA